MKKRNFAPAFLILGLCGKSVMVNLWQRPLSVTANRLVGASAPDLSNPAFFTGSLLKVQHRNGVFFCMCDFVNKVTDVEQPQH